MSKVKSDGWYVSDAHCRRALGYLSYAIPELRAVEIPTIAEEWANALEKTIDPEEASPINSQVVEEGLK